MRRAAFFSAVFYLLSVVGYGLEFHYCLGQLVDVAYAPMGTSCCCDGQGAVSATCCDEEGFFVQVDDDHKAETGKWQPNTGVITIHQNAVAVTSQVVLPPAPISNKPPPIPLYLANNSLVFYA